VEDGILSDSEFLEFLDIREILCCTIPRHSAEFREIPCIFVYGIPGSQDARISRDANNSRNAIKSRNVSNSTNTSNSTMASNSIIATPATARTPVTTQTTAKATLRTLQKKKSQQQHGGRPNTAGM
jgi:hypothetical protein